jgi:hypothetical protein
LSEPDSIELAEMPEELYAGVAASWVVPEEGGAAPLATVCDLTITELKRYPSFLRGDTRPSCIAACDTDGNREAELTDAVYGLDYCFSGTAPPPAPFPGCGPGTETDTMLGCAVPPASCQ